MEDLKCTHPIGDCLFLDNMPKTLRERSEAQGGDSVLDGFVEAWDDAGKDHWFLMLWMRTLLAIGGTMMAAFFLCVLAFPFAIVGAVLWSLGLWVLG